MRLESNQLLVLLAIPISSASDLNAWLRGSITKGRVGICHVSTALQ